MSSSPQVIVVPINEQPEEKINNEEINITKDTQPSYWDIIKMIIIFYAVVGVVCYFFNKEWFNYLYVTPWNYIQSIFNKQPKQEAK